MSDGTLYLGTKRYSSWSLRGWLAVRLAGLDVTEEMIALAGGSTPAVKAASPSGFVPYLVHEGARVWDSLAICEYCAEVHPSLWPAERKARAHARAIAAEMHSGFRELRMNMPMSLFRSGVGAGQQNHLHFPSTARDQSVFRHVGMDLFDLVFALMRCPQRHHGVSAAQHLHRRMQFESEVRHLFGFGHGTHQRVLRHRLGVGCVVGLHPCHFQTRHVGQIR